MVFTGEWCSLIRKLETVEAQLEGTSDPEELRRLGQLVVALKCQQASLRDSGRARVPGRPRPGRYEPTRKEAVAARFDEWVEQEVGRALGDWKLMAEIFDAIERKEHAQSAVVARIGLHRPTGQTSGQGAGSGTRH